MFVDIILPKIIFRLCKVFDPPSVSFILTSIIDFRFIRPSKTFCFQGCLVHVKFFYYCVIELEPFAFVGVGYMCSSEIVT